MNKTYDKVAREADIQQVCSANYGLAEMIAMCAAGSEKAWSEDLVEITVFFETSIMARSYSFSTFYDNASSDIENLA